LILRKSIDRRGIVAFPRNAYRRGIDGDYNPIGHAHGNGGVRPMRDEDLLADANVVEGRMETVNISRTWKI
jgi:hypothetical protein